MGYDLEQQIYTTLKRYPGNIWKDNAEIQTTTDKYTSN